MKSAIRKYRAPFLALLFTVALGLAVSSYILGHQRFYLPNWVPLIGTDFVDYKAEFTTAQAVTPGQGQTVNIAGVPVGDIATVKLVDGHAVIGMKIRRKYSHLIYRNATALLRPKTGLSDMLIQLDPGTPSAGRLDPKDPIRISQTLPNVNLDEILASVDSDTRGYLRLLVAGGGEGLGGQGKHLSAALKRITPINRNVLKITSLLEQRRAKISRAVTNFGSLMDAIGSKDKQLAQLVDASNVSLRAFANQDSHIREALRELPSTLKATNTTLTKADKLARTIGPAAGKLRAGAQALPATERKLQPFFRDTLPIIQNRLRPFSRDVLPTAKILRPTARDLAAIAPDLNQTFSVANYLLNMLAYKPAGNAEGYGYYLAWLNHIGPQIFAGQDANGPIRRGALLISCDTISTAEVAMKNNPRLLSILGLANPVSVKSASAAGGPKDCSARALSNDTGDLGG